MKAKYDWTKPPPGRARLIAWVKAERGRGVLLARELGVTPPAVCRWTRGAARPGKRHWDDIFELTGIKQTEWLQWR